MSALPLPPMMQALDQSRRVIAMPDDKESVRQYLESFSAGIRPPIHISPPMVRDPAAGRTGNMKTLTRRFNKAQESHE